MARLLQNLWLFINLISALTLFRSFCGLRLAMLVYLVCRHRSNCGGDPPRKVTLMFFEYGVGAASWGLANLLKIVPSLDVAGGGAFAASRRGLRSCTNLSPATCALLPFPPVSRPLAALWACARSSRSRRRNAGPSLTLPDCSHSLTGLVVGSPFPVSNSLLWFSSSNITGSVLGFPLATAGGFNDPFGCVGMIVRIHGGWCSTGPFPVNIPTH